MLGKGDCPLADVVADLNVFIIIEGELDCEVGLDGIVVNLEPLALAGFNAVEVLIGCGLCAEKAVIGDFAILHPDDEDGPSCNAAVSPGFPFCQRWPVSTKTQCSMSAPVVE